MYVCMYNVVHLFKYATHLTFVIRLCKTQIYTLHTCKPMNNPNVLQYQKKLYYFNQNWLFEIIYLDTFPKLIK